MPASWKLLLARAAGIGSSGNRVIGNCVEHIRPGLWLLYWTTR